MIGFEKLKLIIVDDEEMICNYLKLIIEKYFSEKILVCGIANDTHEAKQLLEKHKPDIALFDIHLPSENSIEFLKKQTYNAEIIFVTAYDEYAINAFKLHALHYLTKPINETELCEALQFAIDKKNKSSTTVQHFDLNQFSDSTSITLRTTKGMIIQELKKIVYLEANGSYCNFYYEQQAAVKSIMISKPMSYFESILGLNFMRIHRTYIINLKHIVSLNNNVVKLQHNIQLDVAMRRKHELIKKLKSI
jgi:two-component system, LytTR family, response regulator